MHYSSLAYIKFSLTTIDPKNLKHSLIFIQLILFTFVVILPIYAAGEVDRTFSAAVQNAPNGSVNKIVKQPDGKILVGGQFTVINNTARVAIVRINTDGTVDQTFNAPDFYAVTEAGYKTSRTILNEIALQSDGKILVGGNFARINVQNAAGFIRLNSDGSIDTTFNPDLPFATTSASVIKVQSDNKILVFVNTPNSGGVSGRLIRLNPDGSRDTSFADYIARIGAIDIQADGKILVGSDETITRLNSDGSLDISFNTATVQSGKVLQITTLSSGKILAVGSFRIVSSVTVNYIVRLNADGTIDPTFNPGGLGANSTINSFDLLPDGKIVIGGSFRFFNTSTRRAIARLNSDGTVDESFNYNETTGVTIINSVVSAGDGKVYLGGSDYNNVFEKLARSNADGTRDSAFNVQFYQPDNLSQPYFVTQVLGQPDGKVIITGNFSNVYGISRPYLARLNPDGTLDTGFIPALSDRCESIALQADGKIFCGIKRLNADGSIDTTFQPPSGYSSGYALAYKSAIQPDGKILFGGAFSIPGTPVVNVIRLNSDGSEDATFIKIKINQSGSTTVRSITGIKLQTDGKIVVTGNFIQINNVNRGRIARFNANGTIDTSFFSTVGADRDIFDLAIQLDGKIIIGGAFNSVNGVNNTYYLARLLPDSNLDTSFMGYPNAPVYAIEKQSDEKILIGGLFNAVSGISHPFLARLNPNGTPDDFGGIGPNDIVLNIKTIESGKILIGGNFTRVDVFSTIGVARLKSTNFRSKFDFDGDGRSDVSVFRPSNGAWYINQSNNGFTGVTFGQNGDITVPADYDGDGKTDIAVFRNGFWYYLKSSDGTFVAVQWGQSGDIPLPGDFDGDGKADVNVFHPSNGYWYRINSSNNVSASIAFGQSGDIPLSGDFNGDGKADLAVFRPATNSWYIARPTGIPAQNFDSVPFGSGTDIPVPADYDGDGKTDVAVFRPSNGSWYRLNSSNGSFFGIAFGQNGDIPVPADYDGDGKADIAVVRNGVWYYLNSSNGGFVGLTFGFGTDKPIPASFQ